MNTFLLMCWEFFKTGLFAVGGGLATVPFLEEISTKYGWFSLSDLTTMIAVSESTPGPIGINMATYVGNHMFGVVLRLRFLWLRRPLLSSASLRGFWFSSRIQKL